MILGRWWYASEDVPDSEVCGRVQSGNRWEKKFFRNDADCVQDEYSGPFVLWAAETSPLEGSAGEYDDGGEDGDTEE